MIAELMILVSMLAGDFDFDGQQDHARIVPHGRHFDVVIEHSKNGSREVAPGGPFTDPFIEVNKLRGAIKTACGKGYDVDCGPQSPDTIILRGGELIYGQKESTSFVVIKKGHHLLHVQLTD